MWQTLTKKTRHVIRKRVHNHEPEHVIVVISIEWSRCEGSNKCALCAFSSEPSLLIDVDECDEQIFFLSFSIYCLALAFEHYRQVYLVHSGLQDESLQVTISKLP